MPLLSQKKAFFNPVFSAIEKVMDKDVYKLCSKSYDDLSKVYTEHEYYKAVLEILKKRNVEKTIFNVEVKNSIAVVILTTVFSVIIITAILLFTIWDRKKKAQTKIKEKEIRTLQEKMNVFQVRIQEYERIENELLKYKESIKAKEKEFCGLIEKDIDEQRRQFKRSKIYHIIMGLDFEKKEENPKILTYIQQEELVKEIKRCYPRLIRGLTDAYPILTEDDIVICCLSTLNLSTYHISLCYAVSGSNTIKQRKYRIKGKMSEYPEHSLLLRVIYKDKKIKT